MCARMFVAECTVCVIYNVRLLFVVRHILLKSREGTNACLVLS